MASAAAPLPRKAARQIANHHGRELYIYNHIQTKQVVYSLSQNLKVSSHLACFPPHTDINSELRSTETTPFYWQKVRSSRAT
jgi:hypothetical protein